MCNDQKRTYSFGVEINVDNEVIGKDWTSSIHSVIMPAIGGEGLLSFEMADYNNNKPLEGAMKLMNLSNSGKPFNVVVFDYYKNERNGGLRFNGCRLEPFNISDRSTQNPDKSKICMTMTFENCDLVNKDGDSIVNVRQNRSID